jgi:hypothetical protein
VHNKSPSGKEWTTGRADRVCSSPLSPLTISIQIDVQLLHWEDSLDYTSYHRLSQYKLPRDLSCTDPASDGIPVLKYLAF